MITSTYDDTIWYHFRLKMFKKTKIWNVWCFSFENEHDVIVQHCSHCETRNFDYRKHIDLIDISIKTRTHTQSFDLYINQQFLNSFMMFKIKVKAKNMSSYDFNYFTQIHKIVVNLNYSANKTRSKNLNVFSTSVRTIKKNQFKIVKKNSLTIQKLKCEIIVWVCTYKTNNIKIINTRKWVFESILRTLTNVTLMQKRKKSYQHIKRKCINI